MRFLAQTPIVGAGLLVCALVFGHATAASTAAELCPVADNRQNRSVSYRKNVVSAPVTAQDTAALVAFARAMTATYLPNVEADVLATPVACCHWRPR